MSEGPILLVEDEEVVREVVREVLEEGGHSVIEAANGAEALARLEKGPRPRLILLDLMMPVMTGEEFLEARRKAGHDAIPVVVLSATGRDVIAAIVKKHGAQGFLQKPLQLEPLLELVRSYTR